MKYLLLKFGLFLLISIIFLEGLLHLIVQRDRGQEYVLGKKWRPLYPLKVPHYMEKSLSYGQYDPELGWTLRRSAHEGPYVSDINGIRCKISKQFASCIPDTAQKLWGAFGDSFTHGDEVKFEETWSYVLSELSGKPVLNFGVPGYGVDQAYLRFLRWSKKISLKGVILAMVPGDIARNVSIFRMLLYQYPTLKAKPRFILTEQDIRLVGSPSPSPREVEQILKKHNSQKLLSLEYYYVPGMLSSKPWTYFYFSRFLASAMIWNKRHKKRTPIQDLIEGGPMYQLNLEILKLFIRHALEYQLQPVLLFLLEGNALRYELEIKKPGQIWSRTLQNLSHLYGRSVVLVDGSPWLYQYANKHGFHRVFNPNGVHYSPDVHRMIAQNLWRILAEAVIEK